MLVKIPLRPLKKGELLTCQFKIVLLPLQRAEQILRYFRACKSLRFQIPLTKGETGGFFTKMENGWRNIIFIPIKKAAEISGFFYSYKILKLQTLNSDISEPNIISVILKGYFPLFKCGEIFPLGKLTFGHHGFPLIIPKGGFYRLHAI